MWFKKKEVDNSFTPGIYSKCKASIDSCKTVEQLAAANRMVENNAHRLTIPQFDTLKRIVYRHPAYKNMALFNRIIQETEVTFTYIQLSIIFGVVIVGIFSWAYLIRSLL